jgi:CHAT domain-containing protein
MSRDQRWYWLWQLGIVGSLSLGAGYGQCPSAFQIENQIDSIKRQVGGNPVRRLTEIRQQLLRNHCPRDSMFARITMQLGYARYVQGDVDSAIALFNQSINLFRPQAARQSVRLVAAYFYLGQAHQAHDDDGRAQAAYLACLRLGGTNPDHDKMVGYALSGLSLLCYKKGDYEAGLTYAGQAISRAQRCHDHQLEARCLNESARNLLRTGRYTQALTYINRATALVEADRTLIDDQYIYTLFRAQALVGLNQYPAALALFTQLMTYYQRTNQPARMANVGGDIGDLYALKLNQPARARAQYWRAYRAFTDPYEKSRMLQSIGNTLQKTGQYRAALSLLQRALQTLPIPFDGSDLRANPSAGTIQVATNKEYLLTLVWDKADTWFDYADATPGTTNRRVLMKQALATYQVVDQMIDRMRWEQSGQQSKLYWRQQTRRLYEQALETCYRLNDTEQALHFLEKSRAVLLADKLNELGASQALSLKQQTTERALRRAVDNRLADLSRLTPGSAEHTKTRDLLLTDQERVDGFVRQLEQTNPAYFRYKYDNRVPHLADLQLYLKPRQATFVSYFVGDSALYMLSVRSNHTRLIRQPLATYRTDAARYLALLSQPEQINQSYGTFLALSYRLYQRLLAPLTQPTGRIIVSPDGSFIPFETLSQSPIHAAYAINQAAFSYAYSARLLLRQVGPATGTVPSGDFLGFAPGQFAPSLKQAPLPGSQLALEQIGSGFRSSMLLQNAEATRRSFQELAPLYRIIHLFTHATANGEPRLFFADSTLTLSELDQNRMKHAQLVTLAACETGAGVDQAGEGVFSLARGFAALGVPSVLTTLWSVQSKATYQISSRFYRNLADGLPKDIALQQARQDWLQTAEGADLLPSTWAGLILIGDTEPLQTGSENGWLGGLPGLLVGGLVQLGWRRWRRQRALNTRLLST